MLDSRDRVSKVLVVKKKLYLGMGGVKIVSGRWQDFNHWG